MRQRITSWNKERYATLVHEPPIGDEIVSQMERDLYLLWERWGYDGMPDAIRLHPTLRQTIEYDLPHRMVPVFFAARLETPAGEEYFKFSTPQMKTLYGPIYLIDDEMLREQVWMFDHIAGWKARMERSFAQMVAEERQRDMDRRRLVHGPKEW